MYAQFILLLLLGIPISVVDIREHRIPNYLVAVMAAGSLALRAIFDRSHLLHSIEVAGVGLLFAALLWLLTRRRIGMGDLKLLVSLSLVLGDFTRGAFAWFIALLFGLFSMALFRLKSIPFAPSMILATVLTL